MRSDPLHGLTLAFAQAIRVTVAQREDQERHHLWAAVLVFAAVLYFCLLAWLFPLR